MPRLSRLTLSLAAALFCFGAMLFVFGPCLTAMSETFRVPLARLGLLWTCYAAGLLPAVVLTASFSEVAGRRFLLAGSVLVMAAACLLLGAAPSLGPEPGLRLTFLSMPLFGIAAGALQAIVNATLADDNRPSPGFAINFAMALFAAGAVAGPAAASALLRARLPWAWVFYGLAALFLVLFAALLPQRMPRGDDDHLTLARARTLLGSPMLWLLIVVVTLYTGAEVGFNTWVSPFMERGLGASRGLAGTAVSVFWVLMIAGRLGTSAAVTRYRPVALLLLLALGGAAGAAFTARAHHAAAGLVGAALTGLFMSGINGLVLTDATHHFPRHRGAVFGLLCAGIGLGALLAPALMGAITSWSGLRTALALPPCLLAAIGLVYVARARGWSPGREGSAGGEDTADLIRKGETR